MSTSSRSSELTSPNASFLPQDSNLFASFVADAILTRIHASIDSVIANRHEVLEQRLAELMRLPTSPRSVTDNTSIASAAGSHQEAVSATHRDPKRTLSGSSCHVPRVSIEPSVATERGEGVASGGEAMKAIQRRKSRAQTMSTTSLGCPREEVMITKRRSSVPSFPLTLGSPIQTLAVPSPDTNRPPTLPTLLNRITDNSPRVSLQSVSVSAPLASRGMANYKKEEDARPVTHPSMTHSSMETIDVKTLKGNMAMRVLKSVDLVPTLSQINRLSSKSNVSCNSSSKSNASCNSPTVAGPYKVNGNSDQKHRGKQVLDIPATKSSQETQDANARLAWEGCPDLKDQSDLENEFASVMTVSQPSQADFSASLLELSLDLEGSMAAEIDSEDNCYREMCPTDAPTWKRSSVARVEDLRRWRASDLTYGIVIEGRDSNTASRDSNTASRASGSDLLNPHLAEEELIQALGTPAPMLLRLCGIFPWAGSECQRSSIWCLCICYKWMIVLLCILALAVCIKRLLCLHEDIYDRQCQASQQQLLSDVPLAVGSIAGLVSLGVLRHTYSPNHNTYVQDMDHCRMLLIAYLVRAQLFEKWRAWLRWDLVGMLAIWVCAVAERARASGILSADSMETLEMLHIVSFTICSGVIMGLAFCLLYVCRALRLMVDNFCTRIIDTPHVLQAVHDWNVLQAVLRRASNSVEHCFFVMQAAAFSAVLLSIIDTAWADGEITRGIRIHPTALIPGALIALGIGRVFFSAAAVTDKCVHVPSWVNSLTFADGLNMDLERQYVVDYIINSNAGFYIFEVRLSSVLAMKVTYLMCVVAFALASHMLRHFPRTS